MVLRIDRCALAEVYDPITCRLMSAADEGMVQGLNPDVEMSFTQRMTEGTSCCRAELHIVPKAEEV